MPKKLILLPQIRVLYFKGKFYSQYIKASICPQIFNILAILKTLYPAGKIYLNGNEFIYSVV